jgi:UrcA family protein
VPSEEVRYGDLNLSTSAGAKVLYGRIGNAVRRVCRDSIPLGNGRAGVRRRECRHRLMDIAVKQVDRPVLTDLHQEKPVETIAGR